MGLQNKNRCVILALLAGILGCATTPPTGVAQPEPQEVVANTPARKKKIADSGNFLVVYKSSKKFEELAVAVKDAKTLAELVPGLNESFALPKDLPVIFAECGELNAFYSRERGDITICYEFIQYMAEGYAKLATKDYDADEALMNAVTFTFFHELGHALVDIFDLPITGKEEDAVDQLATTILLEIDEGGVAAIHGAQAFHIMASDEADVDNLPYWDEHSFGEQRYFNILCWVYGKNPSPELKGALQRAGMPDRRTDRCTEEFQRMDGAWDILLDAYTKGEDEDEKK